MNTKQENKPATHDPTMSIAKPPHVSPNPVNTEKPQEKTSSLFSKFIKTEPKQTKYHRCGNRKTALVIVAYNRPDYLRRTMKSLINTLASPRNDVMVDIYLSQDGYLTVLDPVVAEMQKMIKSRLPEFQFTHLHHDQIDRDSGYHKLSRHFGWFFSQMFDVYGYDQVIVLEVIISLFSVIPSRTISKWLLTSSPTLTTPLLFCGKIRVSTASVHGMIMDKAIMFLNLVRVLLLLL